MLESFRGLRLSSETPRAKRTKDAKFRNHFLFFAPLAFFAANNPFRIFFGCGCAALGHSYGILGSKQPAGLI
jgi:hypothetical protein